MAIFKCKMCGGDLTITDTAKVVECDFCGTTQTVPSADSEKKLTLFNRANRLRLAGEFDKAAGIYENIVAEFPEEAEAYWGLCLCNYGIEYVDDPATGKKIPTCHRASFEKLSRDENFELAMEYADVRAQKVYRDEAREIDRINAEILSVSKNETPYDIFICYKETDESGSRTPDSVMAQDIYDALIAKGYKVFFARISLENKLGQQYEPYIFAALNSAKIMLCVGTKYEYFHAVWVKNEWSRFVRLATKDKSKMLIPCYKDMDPYDLPDAFKGLQAQDLGKLGAMQDLVRGVEKLLEKDAPTVQPATAPPQTVIVNPAAATVEPILKRAFMFLEDGNWQSADEYAERVLDLDPENGEAYLAKAMATVHVRQREKLSTCRFVDSKAIFKKVFQFGNEELRAEMDGYISNYRKNKELEEEAYQRKQEEKKRKQEENRKRAIAVVNALKNGYRSDTVPTIDEKCAAVKTDIEKLERILSVFDDIQARINIFQSKLDGAILQEQQLSEQREGLGIFAGKEKKRIDEEIAAISAKKNNLSAKIKHLKKTIGFYSSIEKVEHDLSEARNTEKKLEAQIKSERSKNETTLTFEEAVNAYLNEPALTREVDDIYPAAVFIPAMQGETNVIQFGKYVQKRYMKPEPIEWLVLSREKSRMLVISRYALDCQPYDSSYSAHLSWETCSLRKWLNTTFLSAAFNAKERAIIPTVTVTADKNPAYKTNPGKDTTDQVFLLSITEAKKYFNSNSDRQCQGTDYCFNQGASRGDKGNCTWWLRTPGRSDYNASGVDVGGSLDCFGDLTSHRYDAVRPAIWIDFCS